MDPFSFTSHLLNHINPLGKVSHKFGVGANNIKKNGQNCPVEKVGKWN